MSQKTEENSIPARAGAGVLADLLGVSTKTIRELALKGIVIRVREGVYDVRASIRGYAGHMRGIVVGKAGGEALAATAAADRARLARAQADRVELQNQKDRGELLAAAGVQAEWSSILSAVRAGMLAVASRVAARLPHLTRADVGEIDQEIRQVLTAVGTNQQP